MKKKIAILGGGGILGAHAPGWLRLAPEFEIVAVADANPANDARVRQILRNENLPVLRDYREALELPGLDAVDILLPHALHAEATVRAAQKGLHVLCEKVMARDTRECAAMVDACARAGVELVIAHDRRYADGWIQLKDVIDSGRLGEILFIKMEHNQNVNPAGSWIASREALGGGAIMSCLTHQIDALRWYLGEVASVTCMTRVVPGRMEGECIGVMNAMTRSGVLATLSINWHTRSNEGGANGLWYEFNHVTGTRGEAYFMSGRGAFARIGDARDFEPLPPQTPILGGHERCVEAFARKIAGQPGPAVLTHGADSMRTVAVAEAAYLSEARGQTVLIES